MNVERVQEIIREPVKSVGLMECEPSTVKRVCGKVVRRAISPLSFVVSLCCLCGYQCACVCLSVSLCV